MELISPLPGDKIRPPTQDELERDAQGFYDLMAQTGGG